MTVRLADSATICLEGDCTVADAEPLLTHIIATPNAVIDWRQCRQAHMAVVQVLLASGVALRGPPANAFLRLWVEALLVSGA
jgi:hypothetical protein